MTTGPDPATGPVRSADGAVVSAPGARGQQIGDGNTQINVYNGPTTPAWPILVGALPSPADRYQPRPGLSAAIGGASGRVLSGLGGVGKTQLAADHARRHWHARSVDLLVRISATSAAGIQAGYARAAVRAGVATENAPDAAHRFLEWLHTTDRRWLIVLDDLTDPHDLHGWWPPDTATGHTVITTRRRDAVLTGHQVSADDASDGLHNLARLSLVTLRTHPVVRVHGLVQRAVREHATRDPGRHDRTARTAAGALLHLASAAVHDPVAVVQLHVNATALHRNAEATLGAPGGHRLLTRTGVLLGRIGQVAAARDHFRLLTASAHRSPGPDHPDTLTTRSYLAHWRREAQPPA